MFIKNKKGRPGMTSSFINIINTIKVIISRLRIIVNNFYLEANTLGGLL